MKKLITPVATVFAASFAPVVLAHGGHGVTAPANVIHYLIEPLHLVPALLSLIVAGIVVWAVRRKLG